jgi:hypothetical protein
MSPRWRPKAAQSSKHLAVYFMGRQLETYNLISLFVILFMGGHRVYSAPNRKEYQKHKNNNVPLE